MAFCRLSEGDIYMIPAKNGIECIGCELCDESIFTTIEDAIEHILLHAIVGHEATYEEIIDMLQHTTLKMIDGVAYYDTI